jgi:Carbohydrate binding domain.
MIRDGVAEGFSFSVPSDFTAELDEVDKVSGRAAQKISFNRNSSSAAEASLSMSMYFPSDDYPRPGETIRISLWVKAENWVNASLRVRARGLDSSGSADLINTTNVPNAWTELVFNYTVPNSNPQGVRLDLIVRSNAGVSSGVVRTN